MPTTYSATVQATQAKPWILTHRESGERYAYSNGHLAATRSMYQRHGKSLEALYTVVNEYERDLAKERNANRTNPHGHNAEQY